VEGSLVQIGAARPRLPEWARKSPTHFESLHRLKAGFRSSRLHTVCESARCPNIHECFHRGAATFMILGNRCTRGCGFCSVPKGNPEKTDMRLDPEEPANVARMAAAMELRYVVITSVNRDDLEDGGSRHFAETLRRVRQALPEARVEALTPDFQGDCEAVARVLDAGPQVFNHNVETVPRLYRRVRPQADYGQSLAVLGFARRYLRTGSETTGPTAPSRSRLGCAFRAGPKGRPVRERLPAMEPGISWQALAVAAPGSGPLIKSGFMVGLGETEEEVHALLRDLRAAGIDVATIGQYLQPTRRNLPVAAYIEPRQFAAYGEYGRSLGFRAVFSGPLVRSSYMAEAVSEEALRPPC
jgi:lipoic acid synthetase